MSLTISDVSETGFEVALIPGTLAKTTLGFRAQFDFVNIETDIAARILLCSPAFEELRQELADLRNRVNALSGDKEA